MFSYNPRIRIPEAGIGRRQSAARLLLAVLLLTEALLACDSPTKPSVTPVKGADRALTYVRPADPVADAGGETGMRLALSEGSELTAPFSSTPLADSQPLSPDETQALLDRLPELEGADEDQQQLRLPPETLPAPRPGETVEHAFPPPDSAAPIEPAPTSAVLVLRYSPVGDVDLAPHLSITFDQPMVALTAHGDLAVEDIPVEITPLPEGSWKWIGTQTLVFQPSARFPMATEYAVRVQEGTTSATGSRLDEEVSWTFRTPAPQMTAAHPSEGPTVREPLLFVSFDQRVEPTLVLETIRLKAGGEAFPTTLADPQEVGGDSRVAQLAKKAQDQHWLAFRSMEPLPHNTTITVDIGPGTPSAEGPRTTEEVQSFSFRTFGPLEVIDSRCGWSDECRPMMPWQIRFTNPLDEDSFSDSLVQIEPDLPAGKLSIFGDRLQIEGRSEGQTTYQVTLSADIRDRFGQPLGQDNSVTFQVGAAEPVMYSPSDTLVVLDPLSKPTYSVFSINYSVLRVQAYRVTPADWPTYLEYLKESSRTTEPGTPPGRRVIDLEIRVEAVSDSLVETLIDLAPALEDNLGHLILVIEPAQPFLQSVLRRRTTNPVIRVWIQATQIGLDAFAHDAELLVWVTSLASGSALSDIDLELLPGKGQATSDSDGLTRLSLSSSGDGEPAYLVARNGADVAFLPENPRWWSRVWPNNAPSVEYRWYVMDDRQMYRPGEEVHVKGWIRVVRYHEGADDFAIPDSKSSVSYQLSDSRGNQLLDGRLEVNALGGFDTAFVFPEGMNLGTAQLKLTLLDSTQDGASHSHRLQVQEFRRPEFEVSTSTGPGPHFVGAHTMATVEATYFAGGPLPEADVAWNVSSRRGTYRPPGWDDFTFGI